MLLQHRRRCVRFGWSSGAVLAAGVILVAAQAPAANIAWVSFHSADNMPTAAATAAGFTLAPDVGYTDLLTAAGHTVTRVVTSGAPNTATLNGFDLVIVGRSVPSGDYELDAETLAWNTQVTKPMIVMGGYTMRANRLGFMTASTEPVGTTGPIKLTVDPNHLGHPIFAGIPLDGAGTMTNNYSLGLQSIPNGGPVQRGISINTDAIAGGGTLLATTPMGAAVGKVIAEWPAGAMLPNTGDTAGTDTLGGRRLIFQSGSREDGGDASKAGIFDLDADGIQMFRNAVNYMSGPPVLAGDTDLDGDVDMDDFLAIRNNFQKSGRTRITGDLTGDTVTDWRDFRQWKTNFPTPAEAAAGSVPEPASAVLGLTACSVLLGAGRSIRRRRG